MGYNDIRVSSLGNGPASASEDAPLAGGFSNEALVSQVCGKYYALARAGRVFLTSTVIAGVAFPINSSSTTPVFGLWNPSDSGRVVVPLLYSCSYVSGTAVQTGIGIGITSNTGSALATAAPISALTKVAPTNLLIGAGAVAKSTGFSTGTLTAVSTWLMSLGLNTFTGAATVPITVAPRMWYDFEGALIVTPGNLIQTMGNAASVALYQQTLIFAELEA